MREKWGHATTPDSLNHPLAVSPVFHQPQRAKLLQYLLRPGHHLTVLMDDSLDPLPSIEHTHVCTYIECNAQVETSARAYRFGLLKGSPRKMVVFSRRLNISRGAFATWTQINIEDAVANQIRSEVKTVQIPLYSPARSWCSAHCNRSLVFEAQGTALDIWWDSEDSTLGDALRPLLDLLRQVVQGTGLTFEKMYTSTILDDEL